MYHQWTKNVSASRQRFFKISKISFLLLRQIKLSLTLPISHIFLHLILIRSLHMFMTNLNNLSKLTSSRLSRISSRYRIPLKFLISLTKFYTAWMWVMAKKKVFRKSVNGSKKKEMPSSSQGYVKGWRPLRDKLKSLLWINLLCKRQKWMIKKCMLMQE